MTEVGHRDRTEHGFPQTGPAGFRGMNGGLRGPATDYNVKDEGTKLESTAAERMLGSVANRSLGSSGMSCVG